MNKYIKMKMNDSSEIKFNFKLNILAEDKDIFDNYEIIHENKKKALRDMNDKIINNENEVLEFTTHNILIDNHYQVDLNQNYLNEISLFVNKDEANNIQLYNIDFLIQNESFYFPKIQIKYKGSSYKYLTQFNDLNICKITLLDVDLKNLEIYLSQNELYDLNFENYKLLGKKNLNDKKIITGKKLEFKINYANLKTNNLLFCLNYYDTKRHILTIHEKREPYLIKINKNINQSDIDNLDRETTKNIDFLLEIINEEDLDFNSFIKELLNGLNEYDFEDPAIEENNYLIMIEYSKKFLIHIIRKTITEIIKSFFSHYKKPSHTQLNILKKNIKYILLKYEQFNEYINYVEGKESKVTNLILNKNNLSQKEKIEILSTLLTIVLSSPIFEINTNIEFMEINENKRSIYYKSIEFFNKIIDKLNKESYYIRGFRQTFSRIKKDINEVNEYINNENRVFIIENRELNDLKILMKNFIPTKIVRFVNNNSKINAFYDIYSKNVIVNEIIFTNRERYDFNQDNTEIFESLNPIITGNIDLNVESNLFLYNLYTFKSFWRIIHEGLGHKPVSILNNNYEDTPSKFIINGEFHKISDAGRLLEYYINDAREEFEYLLYKNYDAKKLLNENLYIDFNFSKFWNEFYKIKKIEDKLDKKEDKEKEVYLFMIDIYGDNVNLASKVEKYITPRFLWPTHKKLLSII